MEAPGAVEQHDLKMPLSIRLIGHFFLLTGLIFLGEMLIQYVARTSMGINLGIINIFVGAGILCWSNFARRVASFELWIVAIGIPLLLVSGLSFKVYWELGGSAPWQEDISFSSPTVSNWRHASPGDCLFDALLSVAVLIVVIASLRTLRHHETVDMFSDKDRRHFQIGISSFLFFMLTVGILFVSLRPRIIYQDLEIIRKSVPSNSATADTALIAYGLRRHRWEVSNVVVDFVVIDRTAGASVETSTSSLGDGKAAVTGPDGQYLELPVDAKFAEVDDERVLTFDGTVTEQQIQAYLDNNPPYPNIPDLLATPKSVAASP